MTTPRTVERRKRPQPTIPAHDHWQLPVDPSENVSSLVHAEARYQNALRLAEALRQDGLRLADSRRIDDLAAMRVMYETQMSSILTVQVKTTSDLISAQLDKTTTNLGNLITTTNSAVMERVGQLERFRWEVGGANAIKSENKQSLGLVIAACTAIAGFVSIVIALVATQLTHYTPPIP